MKDWFVYIIQTKDHFLYTGVTTDPLRRFQEHLHSKKKGAKFFRSHRPLAIVYLEHFPSRSEAQKREVYIKNQNKPFKLNLISTFDKKNFPPGYFPYSAEF